jgi:hypothetical protein
MKQKFALRLLFCCLSLISFSWPQIKFLELKQELLQARLERAGIKNVERKNALVAMFQEVGCTDHLVEQPAKGSKLPNVICTLPGETDSIIIVGAHFDQVDEGKGIVDNWSGASLLHRTFAYERDAWNPAFQTRHDSGPQNGKLFCLVQALGRLLVRA